MSFDFHNFLCMASVASLAPSPIPDPAPKTPQQPILTAVMSQDSHMSIKKRAETEEERHKITTYNYNFDKFLRDILCFLPRKRKHVIFEGSR